MIRKIFVFLLTYSCLMIGQESSQSPAETEFFPGGLEFLPLKANIQEPRIGIFRFFDRAQMKVDIGNSIDIVQVPLDDYKESSVRIGIDFFAYAYVVDAQGLRLQIDAVDGFFGGHIVYSQLRRTNPLQLRLRVLHHSAHLVDGNYEGAGTWTNPRGPIPYTRDFGEITIAKICSSEEWIARPYGGLSYATLVRPLEVQRFAFFFGGEVVSQKLIGKTFQKPTNIFVTYHLGLAGTPSYSATHQLQAGVKFGEYFGKGVSFYLGYYSGSDMFGEYYDRKLSAIGAGFTVDFF